MLAEVQMRLRDRPSEAGKLERVGDEAGRLVDVRAERTLTRRRHTAAGGEDLLKAREPRAHTPNVAVVVVRARDRNRPQAHSRRHDRRKYR